MSAGMALQAALAHALKQTGKFTGIYDGPPARAPYPYLALDASRERNWGHKTGKGRDVFVALTVWDDRPERLTVLADVAEDVASGLSMVDGWQLVTIAFVKRRIVRDVAGPWAAIVDLRARLLEQNI